MCGERTGLIHEKPFAMGETLNGKNKVDIHAEMQLVQDKSKQLKEQGSSEEEINVAMKDLGLERSACVQFQIQKLETRSIESPLDDNVK